ncbi:MAG: DNA methyltransferase [Saprospiraceae bacterium]
MQTLEGIGNLKGHSTAEARWAGFGPYYAMFPIEFAFKVVNEFSSSGESVLDPFAGRCSSIYAASVLGRRGVGIEINPVGWLYGKVKINPAEIGLVMERLHEVYESRNQFSNQLEDLSEFFHVCYCREVLLFLLACREQLNWRQNDVDATLMGIILVYLHGKLGEGLSNQMRQTKAMGLDYSVKWWREKNMEQPPQLNPLDILAEKIKWRYEKGIPNGEKSEVIFGDSTVELAKIKDRIPTNFPKFSLLFTSPPYYSITNYHADQWLRLWVLGGKPFPTYGGHEHKGRFLSKEKYKDLLSRVFSESASLLKVDCVVYVRTDARKFTLETTKEILQTSFPKHKLLETAKPFHSRTQTELFGDTSKKPGEVDLILTV